MAKIKDDDFVELEFDLYANDRLVQTTIEKNGKEAGLKIEKYGPQVIIVGKGFVLSALDRDIVKNGEVGKSSKIELEAKDAYGIREKKLIKVLPKSAFDEHKMRPVIGVVYDFNGTYGTVKSIIGGRIMVDFNNPLSGKKIKIKYKVLSIIDNIEKKVLTVMENILRMSKGMYTVNIKNKNVVIEVPEQLVAIKEQLLKTFDDYIVDIKNYSVKIETFKKK